ncbi:hypothetical protein KDL01_19345 [Actinospica durhamensis]|uniref:Secreted protein n=1 Tax=Actinospica durhamensis TaxID=1508375 RepID=A0A941IPR8_9ACTN|nr:hypothetical protein [Actinospica durhamensis]MBR7835439.1 hypothetical protein [Actinospica durhamensis]
MKIKNILAATVVAGALATTGILGAGAAQAATPLRAAAPAATLAELRDAHQLTLLELIDVVRYDVRESFPTSTLMLADGASPSGPTTDMYKVTDWRFVFNTNDPTSRIKSLQVNATLAGAIQPPTYYTAPWGGVASIPDWVGMSPELAYHILRTAGHGNAYQYVSLLKPLVANPQLQYHFSNIRGGCDGFAVNVNDGVVQPICG